MVKADLYHLWITRARAKERQMALPLALTMLQKSGTNLPCLSVRICVLIEFRDILIAPNHNLVLSLIERKKTGDRIQNTVDPKGMRTSKPFHEAGIHPLEGGKKQEC